MEERLLDDCVCPIGPLTPQDGRKTRESRPFRRALVAACRKDHLVLICRAQCRLVLVGETIWTLSTRESLTVT